jgi:hypothetical protein
MLQQVIWHGEGVVKVIRIVYVAFVTERCSSYIAFECCIPISWCSIWHLNVAFYKPDVPYVKPV